ncbi:MAG: hypothetical protein P4L76_02980 [Beijerinckiaceae bacterium]|nr:hypothetical protein [Beijerinckiaceae bacterium]
MRLKTNRIARLAFPARTANKAKPWRALAPALVLALIICPLGPLHAADDDDDGSQSPGFLDSIGKNISNGFSSMGKKMGLGKPPGPPPAESPSGCPAIVVLDGTGAQRIMVNAEAGNQGLRYQYSIAEVARECHIDNNQMTIKVGVTGRVLLGPSGAPGGFKVPIRIAIVDEHDQKPALSKLYQIDASIPAGQTATPYALVADSLVIPFGAGKTASDYSIKVGIDGVKADKTEKANRLGPSVAAAADPSLKPSPKPGGQGGGGGNNRAGNAMQR